LLLFIRQRSIEKKYEKKNKNRKKERKRRRRKRRTITTKSSFDSIGERTDARVEKNANIQKAREKKRM